MAARKSLGGMAPKKVRTVKAARISRPGFGFYNEDEEEEEQAVGSGLLSETELD